MQSTKKSRLPHADASAEKAASTEAEILDVAGKDVSRAKLWASGAVHPFAERFALVSESKFRPFAG